LLRVPKDFGPEQVSIQICGSRIFAEVHSHERAAPTQPQTPVKLVDRIGFSDAGLSQKHAATVGEY
jgi:hypothetical protein